jgi:hypothetical protein
VSWLTHHIDPEPVEPLFPNGFGHFCTRLSLKEMTRWQGFFVTGFLAGLSAMVTAGLGMDWRGTVFNLAVAAVFFTAAWQRRMWPIYLGIALWLLLGLMILSHAISSNGADGNRQKSLPTSTAAQFATTMGSNEHV